MWLSAENGVITFTAYSQKGIRMTPEYAIQMPVFHAATCDGIPGVKCFEAVITAQFSANRFN